MFIFPSIYKHKHKYHDKYIYTHTATHTRALLSSIPIPHTQDSRPEIQIQINEAISAIKSEEKGWLSGCIRDQTRR